MDDAETWRWIAYAVLAAADVALLCLAYEIGFSRGRDAESDLKLEAIAAREAVKHSGNIQRTLETNLNALDAELQALKAEKASAPPPTKRARQRNLGVRK